jgi:hypothetical protein
MRRILILIAIGVAVFGLSPLSAYAEDYPFFGPQPPEDDYLYFGDSTYPKLQQHGLTLSLQEESISFQSIIGSVTLQYVPNSTLIDERQITQFYVIANGRVVDMFQPAWDVENETWRQHYPLRIALADWNIGSLVNLQVVAVSHREENPTNPDYQNTYAVAWSEQMGPYQLKPQPVIDRDAIEVLQMILAKLEQMRSDITGKLSQIDASIKAIYEIPPATQAKFDNALANLQSKLPTEQVKQQTEQVANIVKDSANRIQNAPQKIKFGEINWMGVVTTPAVDFTDFMDDIEKMRVLLQIMLWCEFFYFVILILRPRLTV